MKFAISTAALLLLLGTTASAHARQEKGQEEHQQEAKPAQKEAKPAPQQHAQAKAAPQAHAQAKPAQKQPTQQAARAKQPQTHAVARAQAQPAGGNRGGSAHGRISNAHYAASFGSGHRFHVSQGDYANHRFQYGGYSFGFVDPWPVGWGYSDNVYVVYVGGGYYMYDTIHPGVRISLNIL